MNQHSSVRVVDNILPDFSKYGYPLEIFCTKQIVELLTCVICLGVYRDPVTSTTCGHSFCKPCFADLRAKGGFSTTCPDCRKVITSTVDTFAIKTSILNQQVKCPLNAIKKLPCEWEGKLDQLESHVEYDCKQVPRQKLKGYPPAIFVNLAKKEDLMCNLCNGIFREPVITECGHIFCRICITEHEESSLANNQFGKKLCPRCLEGYDRLTPVSHMQKMITSEQVACTAEVQKKQCVWKGSVEDWEIHRRNCKGVLKDKGAFEQEFLPYSAQNNQRRINAGQIMPEISVPQDHHYQPQNNQGHPPQLPVSRHIVLDSCEGCCALAEKAIKSVLLLLLRLLFAVLMFALYLSTIGYLIPLREPAIIAAFLLMSYSASSGWILFFGVFTPMILLIFFDIFWWFDITNMANNRSMRAMDWISIKYMFYICTICNDATFASASQQEKEKMTNLWHHLYWWLMKSGIYIMTIVWTVLIDETSTVPDFASLNIACQIVVGINLGMDVLDYFLTFRRIRKLHREHHL